MITGDASPPSAAVPLAISPKTFECLTSTAPRPMPDVRKLNPYVYTLNQTESGDCLYFHLTGNFSMVFIKPSQFRPDGAAVVTFERDCVFSNFCEANGAMPWHLHGQPIDFKCGEQAFKCASVVCQMDPADDSSEKAMLLAGVLGDIMASNSPKRCKLVVHEIPVEMFDSVSWDRISVFVMTEIQKWKMTIPSLHAFVQGVAQTAMGLGIKSIYAVEGSDPVWGAGVSLDEYHAEVMANYSNPDFRLLALPGQNRMGIALTKALEMVLGENFEHVGETVDGYIARYRAMSCNGGMECPLFVYRQPLPVSVDHGEESMATTLGLNGVVSDEVEEESPTNVIGRTGSMECDPEVEEGEIVEEPVVRRTDSVKRPRDDYEGSA